MKYLGIALGLMLMCLPVVAIEAAGIEYPWCAQQDIFFRNDTSDIADHKIISHKPELASTQIISVSLNSDTSPKTLSMWITPNGSPGNLTLAPGLWRFRAYYNVSSTVGITTAEYKVYNHHANGTETDLFYGQVISNDVNSLTPIEYLNSYARRNYTYFNTGDRLEIRVNASTDSQVNRTLTMSVAGNTQASMVTVGYFVCHALEDIDIPAQRSSMSGGEATGIIFGVAGGMIGALIVIKRRNQ